jgi:hypothetical protein
VIEVPDVASIGGPVIHSGAVLRRAAARVAHTWAGDRAARFGLAARSVVYLILAYLVVRISLGALGEPTTSRTADGPGVAQAVAAQTGGRVVVFVLGIGLLLFALFSALDALLHHNRERPEAKRWANRALSVWTVLVYLAFGAYCLATAFGATSDNATRNDQRSTEWSARVLRWPLGQVWLFLLGAVLLVSAAVLLVEAARRSFCGQLDMRRLRGRIRPVTIALGTTGYVGRAALFGIVGGFVVNAAITEDPHHGTGVDGSIRILAATGYGAALLAALAAALACYGVYMALEAVYRRV